LFSLRAYQLFLSSIAESAPRATSPAASADIDSSDAILPLSVHIAKRSIAKAFHWQSSLLHFFALRQASSYQS